MITCSTCSHQNPDSARFCMHCGQVLPQICPNCGTHNPQEARFCFHCGQNLQAAAASMAKTPEPAIPMTQAEETLPAQPGLTGERRVVTMLFCDVSGSTEAAGQLDPEEWHEIINGAFERMIAPVYRYEGTLARLMGDAILAFFGAPVTHEDDPQRAILAGLDIVRELAPYWESVRSRWNVSANVRVGINTGLVVVGAVGSDLKMEYTAIGDAINIASRMEQSAEPGTILVSENTYRLASPLFEWQDLGFKSVKGKTDPVRTYRPLFPKADPGSLRGIEGLDAPMVGRTKEFRLIENALEKLQGGSGGILFITGEAGLGKSRLIREAHKAWAKNDPNLGRPPHWIEQRATSFDTAQTYGLIKAQIRLLCGLEEGSSISQIQQHLAGWGGTLQEEIREEVTSSFLQVLGAGEKPSDAAASGEVFKNRFFAAMLAYFQHRHRQQPAVLVLDDMHWADSASVDLIDHLLQLVDEYPIVFLIATRPDRESPGWALKTIAADRYPHRFAWLEIQPLSPDEGEDLVDHLLTVSDLPAQLRKRIQQKSDGNPFFVEEIIRTLIDNGLLQKQGQHWVLQQDIEAIDIPDSIQSLLSARIDRLAEETRRVLQLASVIGRTFYFRVLSQIAETRDALDRHLSDLQRVQMIAEAARIPELEYIFRHALTQETAYRSILRQQRRVFHSRVGHALESLFPEQLDEHAALLGFHYEQAQEPDKALHFYRRAGDAAFRLYANQEAARLYQKALDLMKNGAESSEDLLFIFGQIGRAHELNGQFDLALSHYEGMAAWAQENAIPRIELHAVMGQALLHSTPTEIFDKDLGAQLVQKSLAQANELGDQKALAKIYWIECLRLRLAGETHAAYEFGQKSLALSESLGLEQQRAQTLHDLGYLHNESGRINDSIEAFRLSEAYWRKTKNLTMLADNLSGNLINYWIYGKYDEALHSGDESYRISRQTHNLWGQAFSQMNIGFVFWDRGDYAEALARADLSISLGEESGFPIPVYFCRFIQSLVLADLGMHDKGMELAEELMNNQRLQLFSESAMMGIGAKAYNLVRSGRGKEALELFESGKFEGFPDTQGFFLLVGLLHVLSLLLSGYPDRALARLDLFQADELAQQARSLISEILLYKAEALHQTGRITEAMDVLGPALKHAERVRQRRVLWRMYWLRSVLARKQGQASLAAESHEQARVVLREIGERCGEELRSSFLSQPEVQKVLGG